METLQMAEPQDELEALLDRISTKGDIPSTAPAPLDTRKKFPCVKCRGKVGSVMFRLITEFLATLVIIGSIFWVPWLHLIITGHPLHF